MFQKFTTKELIGVTIRHGVTYKKSIDSVLDQSGPIIFYNYDNPFFIFYFYFMHSFPKTVDVLGVSQWPSYQLELPLVLMPSWGIRTNNQLKH